MKTHLPLMTTVDILYDELVRMVQADNELLQWEAQREQLVDAGQEPDHKPYCPWCGYEQCDGRNGDYSLCDN